MEIYLKFKRNKKVFLVFESINIQKQYEKEEAVNLISKKINTFIKNKHTRKIYIHGILGFALTDFEKQIYENLGFVKLKEYENNVFLYELTIDEISNI